MCPTADTFSGMSHIITHSCDSSTINRSCVHQLREPEHQAEMCMYVKSIVFFVMAEN